MFLRSVRPVVILGLSTLWLGSANAGDNGAMMTKLLQDNFAVLSMAQPFQNNNGEVPPYKIYRGPLFELNHDWSTQPLPKLSNAPWQAAIGNGTINIGNAPLYAAALKKAISPQGRELTMHYDTWNARAAKWYNEPWLGSLREPIHGTYQAGEFGPKIFPGTGLDVVFRTTVVTYYDERAAYSLNKVWGTTATEPKIETKAFQFDEGSIIVKAAIFYSTEKTRQTRWWNAMDGAQSWLLYTPVAKQEADPQPPPQLWSGYVAQFDIIVKDSQSAPQTGWVFTTLVYDSSAPGDFWDKMIPLGAQWGNDPEAKGEPALLKQNWNNPKAPKYATQTLGWGGRLSGPNDGGKNAIAFDGKSYDNYADSGCMSCHSTSQWNAQAHKMDSFLLPSLPPVAGERAPFLECGDNGQPKLGGNYICSPPPASPLWMKWFQNRLGTQPMDAGSVATDFDEVFAFKSLPLWWAANGPANQAPQTMLMRPNLATMFNQYNGAPLAKPEVLQ